MPETIARTAAERERGLHLQVYPRQPLVVVRGEGCWVWNEAGDRYLDLVAGIAVNILGHAHPAVAEALERQARTLLTASNLYYTLPQLDLADALIGRSRFDRVFFANSGTEANEAAIKLARRHGGQRSASRIVSAVDSFHGRTLGSLAATGQPKYAEPFAPLPGGFAHVPINDVDALDAAVDDATAAILLEPIQGEGGIRPLTDEYLSAARAAADRVGALLILDEIQTGMGRTGTFFAFEQTPVMPDAVTIGKGLGGGVPISALLVREPAAAFHVGDHGTTLGGNPLACAAALATLEVIDREDLTERAHEAGERLVVGLRALVDEGLATEVRGRGLMLGLETAGPWARDAVAAARDRHHLLINATGDTTIRLVPPLVVSDEEIDTGLERLGAALREAAAA
jgi:predicted acetylornithine/succinylornithine family transaminase